MQSKIETKRSKRIKDEWKVIIMAFGADMELFLMLPITMIKVLLINTESLSETQPISFFRAEIETSMLSPTPNPSKPAVLRITNPENGTKSQHKLLKNIKKE